MRIAFVNPQGNFDAAGSHLTAHPDFGGQLVYVREVALALALLGHDVDILTRRVRDPLWPEFADDRASYPGHPGVRILRFPCGPDGFVPKEQLWPFLRKWVERIAGWYREEERWPDLWTGHYADGGLGAALLQETSGVPFTFTGHSLGAWKLDGLLRPGSSAGSEPDDRALAEADRALNFGARLAAERTSVARAAAVVTNSSAERYGQYAHPAYRDVIDTGDDRRFAVIPPGVDLAVFGPNVRSTREEEVRAAIGAGIARDIALSRRSLRAVIDWSRLDPKKGHLALVRAYGSSPELRERANLLLVTRGVPDPLRHPEEAPEPERTLVRAVVTEIERMGLRGSVAAFSLEGQDAAAALYRWGAETGGVFCLPAQHEPFSLSLVEAMASGLPVVATSNGGPVEITDGGEAGLLADPADREELAAKLLRLVGDRGAWRRYAARGQARARTTYDWGRTAEGYVALAEQVASGARVGDRSYPLPAFARGEGGVPLGLGLPRLEGWEMAEEQTRRHG